MIRGHDSQATEMLEAARTGRLHHAWLFAGPQGIGKASFAEAMALRLLAEASGRAPRMAGLAVEPDHPAAHLFAAGSHPDYRRLERLAREKTGDVARSITVDQVRQLGPMFATAPSMSDRRVVVIDAIDDLERSAANALLKSLEEPPAGTTFLLVSHAPGRLLPTIRSRCRMLRFAPLTIAEVATVLNDLLGDPDEAEVLAQLAGGAPGIALRYAGQDVAALDAAIERIAGQGDRGNAERVALSRALSSKSAQPRYELFLERAPARIAAAAHGRQGAALAAALALWERARAIADGAVRLSLDPQTTVFELGSLLAALAPEPSAATS